MNGRIKDLAYKAVLLANEVFDYKGKEYSEIVQEKFAELIVEECMMLCGAVSGAAQVARPNDAFGDGAEKCKSLIKEHFGVEE
jgi:hypothetical protein